MTETTLAPAATSNNKPLWVAVGVLGVAVIALGATLINVQNQPIEARLILPPADQTSANAKSPEAIPVAKPTATAATNPSNQATLKSEKFIQNKAVAQVNKAQQATNSVAIKSQASAANTQSDPTPLPEQTPAKTICVNCGTVQSVTPVEREGTPSGVGVVAGGVLGAVVGNQVGSGDGKTLATILGAVGGGMAGNSVEKKMKKVTHYNVTLRMEDGSTRTVQHATLVAVGDKVTLDGNTLNVTR